MTETKKAKGTSGTELTRFNAFRHGLLSRFTVLPWESSEEFESVLEALAVEYAPQGPTEEHLVEELAHILWRKRRLRLAESATHRRAFGKVLSPLNHISEDAVITIPRTSKGEWVEEAVSATDQQSAEELAELKQEREKARTAVEVIQAGGSDAYEKSVQALGPHAHEDWQDCITYDTADLISYDFEDDEKFNANATDLLRFLTQYFLPKHDVRETQITSRPAVQAQAFGESFDPDRLEVLARYEVHLDRKLERILSMLLGLKDVRRSVDRD
jgi:hypothetical protein